MLPYRRLFKYRMGRYSGSYEISPKYRLIIRYSIYRSIAIPSSIDIDRSQVSRYFDISSIELARTASACCGTSTTLFDMWHHKLPVPILASKVESHCTVLCSDN